MLRYIGWVLRIVLWAAAVLFLHYVLPQRDIARVTLTDVIPNFQTDYPIFFSQHDAGTAAQPTRPLRLISAERKQTWLFGLIRGGDQTMVYRNEDTGWIWPPYFKFDSSDLQSEAEDLISRVEDPKWVVVTHYGWRIRFITIYPNAISIRQVEGPDAVLIPWFNIIFLSVLAAICWAIRVRWRRFRDRRISPVVAGIDATIGEQTSAVSRWFATWRRK